MGRFGIWELVIIAILVLVIFGGRRLPELGRGLGQGLANFRQGLRGTPPPDPAPDAARKEPADQPGREA